MQELTIDDRQYRVLNTGIPVSEKDIATLETRIASKIPSQLRHFYLRWNGGLPYPLDIPEDQSVWIPLRWPKDSDAASVGAETDFNGMLLINADPNQDFYSTWEDFRERIPTDCLAFGRDSGGGIFLIGVKQHNLGQIYFWELSYEDDGDRGEVQKFKNVAEVAKTFKEFLLAFQKEPKF